MKVLVPIKRTVDYNINVRVKPDNTGVDLTNVKMAMNPFCEIAVEEAVRLKERNIATEIVIVSVGEKAAQEQIRTALALGGDRGVLIETEKYLEPLQIAKLLQKVVEDESPDLIILGKQSIDSENNQTGQMLAALTGMPQGTFASDITIQDGRAQIEREIDGGLQTVSILLPAVITTDLRLNEPRYASLPNIMKAKRKPIDIKSASDLDIDLIAKTKILKVYPPTQRKVGIKVNSVEELVDNLKNKSKVIA